MLLGTRGLRASFGFAEELPHRGCKGLGRVVGREITTSLFPNRARSGIVVQQAPRGGGKRVGIIVGHSDAGIVDGKGRRGSSHRHHRELPGKRIEHLDREPSFGPPRNPSQIGRYVRQRSSPLPVDTAEVNGIGDA